MKALISICLFINSFTHAQTVDWAKVIGGASIDVTGVSVATDAQGNSYTTGYFYDSPNFGSFNLTSSGGSDVFISKSDPSGNVLWVKQLGGSGFDFGYSVVVDPSGNIYATGNFEGSVVIDSYILSSTVGKNVYMCKLNSSGTVLWAKEYMASDFANIFSICTDPSGNIYGTGTYSGTVTFGTYTNTSVGNNDGCVFKLDPSGNVTWFNSFGGLGFEGGGSIASDPNGNVYVCGRFESTVSIGSFNLISAGASDVFAAKLNPAGIYLWVKQFGGVGNDMGGCVSVNSVGEIFTAGIFQSPATFGSFTLTTGSSFVNKFDAAGNVIWVNMFEAFMSTSDIVINSIASDPLGNIYTTGKFIGGASFGPSTSTSSILSSDPFSEDGFISKLDASGNFAWVKQLNGTGNDVGRSITYNSGKVYTTGRFEATATIDSYTLANSGAFLIKISSDPLGIKENFIKSGNTSINVFVYPNPSSDKIKIEVDEEVKDAELSLINISGIELLNINNFNTNIESLDIAFLSSGIYFLKINTGKQNSVVKIIKE